MSLPAQSLSPRPAFRALLIAFVVALVSGCSREPPIATDVVFTPCRLKGIEIALRCAGIPVAEDRERSSDPGTRRIVLGVAVIPALARNPQPDPIFILAGGPGQAASAVAGPLYAAFSKLNRDRDIVLVDQRGTGKSNPLSCAPEVSSDSLRDELDPNRVDERIAQCARRLSESSDLTRYTTSIAMADLDDVRQQLGYRRINLWGGSYGTRAALEYVRQFPDRVRTMTIDGVAPAWQKLPLSFGVDTYATLMGLVDACRRDAACAKRYPTLAGDVDAVIARLGGNGVVTSITDPVTGRAEAVRVTRISLAQLLRTPLYSSITASLLPAAFEKAVHGDFDMLAALTYTVGSGLEDQISMGMHLSVICSEDEPSITATERAAAAAEATRSVVDGRPNPFARIFEEQYRHFCAAWPARPAPAAFFETLAGKPGANVPTLLLSGGIDPATPPAQAESVARAMTDAKHLVAPGIGHGVSLQGCAPDLIEQFIKSAEPKSIDGRCLAAIPRPPFFAPIVGGNRNTEKAPLP